MSVEFKDYYTTLGLSRDATPDEIKKAFRKLARIHHPDVAKDKAASDAKFKEINEANEISDTERQRRLFFAQLYVGIYKELTGDTEAALDLLRAAAASKWGQTASGGPTYMWQVARLHFEQLVARVAREEIKALPAEITEKAEERPGT